MATTSLWSAILLTCIVFLIMTASSKSVYKANIGNEYKDIESVLGSIEDLLKYYVSDIMDLNLDGFFGVRALEGHMMVLLEEHKDGKHKDIPNFVWKNVSRLVKIANMVSEKGMAFVRKDNPTYFDDFSSIVKYPWTFFKAQRRLDPALRWEIPQYKAKSKTRLSEKLSDKCMKEVMLSSPTNCSVSDLCVETMTSRGFTGYGITHQLLWSMIVEKSPHCKKPIEAAFKSHEMDSLESMQIEMCTNNFYEMVAVVHVLMKGRIHESHQDLFLEQQFVCPSLGFYEFIKKDYLEQILSWQYPSGCFGDKEEEETNNDDNVNVGDLLETYHKKSANQGRKLLVEKRLTGDCLSHKTGVAAGALIIYLRYLIQPGDAKWSGPPELFERDRKNMIQSVDKTEDDLDDEQVDGNDDIDYVDDNDKNTDDKESVERGIGDEEIDRFKNDDIQDEHIEVKLKEGNLFPKQEIQIGELRREARLRSGIDNKGSDIFPNVLYANVEEANMTANHPSAFLIVLVSLSPMALIFFFLFKVVRRYRILSLCFNV